MSPRVLFYVQHLLGIGHLARASRIAGALAEDGFAVTVVTGGTPVQGFPGPKVEHVALPAVTTPDEGFSGLADASGVPVGERFKADRRDLLLETFRRCRPDIVVTEAFPFGRRQMRFELMPLIAAIEAAKPRPKLVASIRDILQERVKPGRNDETADLVNGHFDLVMVHGDPRFARLEETFDAAGRIVKPVDYTGLVAPPPPPPASERYDVLVSAGGGAAGAGLVAATVDAALKMPASGRWLLITGPNLPQAAFEQARSQAPEHLEIVRFRTDFASLLGGASLSVSQAGYNTVCDLLIARCRAILVPFAAAGETEQTFRAARLKALGMADVVPENQLGGVSLAAAIEAALAKPAPAHTSLDLDGAAGSCRVLRGLL